MPKTLLLAVLFLSSLAAAAQDAVTAIGKERANASGVEWDVKDVTHPKLGAIRFASRKVALTTPVGNEKIVSQAYVSCQKSVGRIAIELSNAAMSNLAGGLSPKEMPRLTCYSPNPRGGGLAMTELALKWEISELGDTLARGIAAADLRRCASIDVLQNLALPLGWPYASQQVAMEFLPFSRAIDEVLVACGAKPAYASAPPQAPAQASPARPVSPAATAPPSQPAPSAADAWRRARTIAAGRTNIRSAPAVSSRLAGQLPPGSPILAQPVSGDWWKVKPRSGAGFAGYIREDRLVFE
ncbi:MAG: hypothetical protein KJ007_15385 [Burkholderiales bacterium]|nr:hypothetical protein [Burkholderiales bacterium]